MMGIYPKLLNIIFPLEKREGTSDVERDYQAALLAWQQWDVVWELLTIELGPTQADHEWDERADTVEIEAVKFIKSWVKAHRRTQHLYMHLLVAHVPDMIRMHGSLVPYQTQGLEHMHSIRKRLGLQNSNRKVGERTTTIMMHLITMDEMHKTYFNSLDAKAHEQDKKNRVTRALRTLKKANARKEKTL